jgi:inositol phosphorylceramide synthase catalytic subunit
MTALARVYRHMRELWPRWTFLPPLPFLVALAVSIVRGDTRWEHVGLIGVVLFLAYTNRTTKKLFVGLFPMGLVALFYDAMRLVKNWGVSESSVHLCDLRAAEQRFFGLSGGRTLQDWFQAHATPVADLFFAIPYGTFIFVVMGFSVWLYFRDFPTMQRFNWLFLLMNVMGFVTYHLFPAAPPWYFHAHGCVVDVLARANEGPNLARVDAMLGMNYFHGMYGRSSDVYGAIPSLHVAYPLVIVLEGWRLFGTFWRAASLSFFVSMCVAAVYLDHHWVIDVIVGLAYALAAFGFVRILVARLTRRSSYAGTLSHGAAE